jgi:hypothetical protein
MTSRTHPVLSFGGSSWETTVFIIFVRERLLMCGMSGNFKPVFQIFIPEAISCQKNHRHSAGIYLFFRLLHVPST